MEKQKRIPKRRFREFLEAGEWEEKKLGEIAPIIMGQSPDGSSYTNNPSDNILVQGNADMRERKVFPRVWTKQVTKIGQKGDIIISVRAPVGDVGKTDYNVVLGRGVAAIRGKEFLYQSLIKLEFNKYWSNVSTGTTFDSIDSKTLSVVEIALPLTEEQQKIGDFCRRLDTLISLHQQKLAKLKDLKQAYLTEMFPAPGEKRPRRRFKGFSGDWEEKKLADFTDIKTGPFGSALHAEDYVNDGVPIITTEHFKTGLLPFDKVGLPQVSNDDYMRLSSYVMQKGDIVFSRVGSVDINALVESEQSGWLFSGRVLRVRPSEKIDSTFLHIALETEDVKQDIIARAVGQTMPSINTEILKATSVILPISQGEQYTIGKFFNMLSSQIGVQEKHLSKLQSLKQAYLSELFV